MTSQTGDSDLPAGDQYYDDEAWQGAEEEKSMTSGENPPNTTQQIQYIGKHTQMTFQNCPVLT